jgi:hypothetical protein
MSKITEEQLFFMPNIEVGGVGNNNTMLRMEQSSFLVVGTDSKAREKMSIV